MKAIEALQEYIRRNFDDTTATKYIKEAMEFYNRSGMDGILNWFIESRSNDFFNKSRCYAILGKKDQALDCLEEINENPPIAFSKINNNYDFNSLRSNPRFQAIIKKMGLSDYQIPN